MPSDRSVLTQDGIIRLTDGEIAYPRQYLIAGDRPGFYVAYYNITGSSQAVDQGQISSFSEFKGG